MVRTLDDRAALRGWYKIMQRVDSSYFSSSILVF